MGPAGGIDHAGMLRGMEEAGDGLQQRKEKMDAFGGGVLDKNAIKHARAEDFEIMNNRQRLVHTQPFTDSEIKDAFFTFDMSGNGFVGGSEIRFVLDALGEIVTDEEIDEMIRMIDQDGDGQVNFKEFYRMASGDSLAPLGLALPPPKDNNEAKQLNKALEQKQEAIKQQTMAAASGSALGRTNMNKTKAAGAGNIVSALAAALQDPAAQTRPSA